jgi:hypothetical protein
MSIQPERLKSILRVEFVFIAPLIAVLLITSNVWCQRPGRTSQNRRNQTWKGLHGTIEMGVQFRELEGDHPAKFQETRDGPKRGHYAETEAGFQFCRFSPPSVS